jgi:hypothetical protein
LSAAGASAEFLAGMLRQEPPQMDPAGLGADGGCAGSPVIWREPALAETSSATRPGARPPAVRLPGGDQLFDRLGPEFTLIDLTPRADGRSLVAAAVARGIPMTHLPITDPAVRTGWAGRLVLIRPDQHIAWRGDAAGEWHPVLDVVTGHRQQDHVNT